MANDMTIVVDVTGRIIWPEHSEKTEEEKRAANFSLNTLLQACLTDRWMPELVAVLQQAYAAQGEHFAMTPEGNLIKQSGPRGGEEDA